MRPIKAIAPRPDQIGEPNKIDNTTIDRFFNTDAFAQAAPFRWARPDATPSSVRASTTGTSHFLTVLPWTKNERCSSALKRSIF
jgi:hypothetical protein